MEVLVDTDLDTLLTALYVTTDDLLKAHPEQAPARPAVGIVPRISDAELIVLSVMQALLGYRSETRWLRRVNKDFRGLFPLRARPVRVQQTPAETRRDHRLADRPDRCPGKRGRR